MKDRVDFNMVIWCRC